MIKRFLELEWKQFFRSSNWQKSIVVNIFMVFIAIYFIVVFLALGLSLFTVIKKFYPDSDPFIVANGFLFSWLVMDLLIRFFFQKLPVMSVKPLLTLPIKRKTVVNFVLGKSALSFFNFLPLFAIVPFSVILFLEGYSGATVLTWAFTLLILVLINNFLNFIIESLSAETELSFLPIIVLSSALFGLDYFNIISFSEFLGNGILYIANNPLFITIPLAVLIILYYFNFRILSQKLYLDSSLKAKTKEVKSANLDWTKKFGDQAPFMQLDIRLMLRNKRSKSSVFILVMGLFYGLFFYTQDFWLETPIAFVFVGIFVTGIFLISFGQFIPAWDAEYYKLLMSQNIPYEKYLKSKFTLMIASVGILFILNIPYVYFGWKILLAHFAAAIYNIGINSHVILYAGSFNRKKIKLDERAAFNYQGTGAVQWLVSLPLMLLPMLIFMAFYFTIGFELGIIGLIIIGLLGIIFHQKLMKHITGKYIDSKYKMIDAFGQES